MQPKKYYKIIWGIVNRGKNHFKIAIKNCLLPKSLVAIYYTVTNEQESVL